MDSPYDQVYPNAEGAKVSIRFLIRSNARGPAVASANTVSSRGPAHLRLTACSPLILFHLGACPVQWLRLRFGA
jgi:hypothetical protein